MTALELSKEESVPVGHIPSGLFIVCAYDTDSKRVDGFLASFIQQVSFKPLLVSLCIKPGRPAYDLIKASQNFSINVIGDHEKNYMKHFWSGYDADKNPFSEIPHTINEKGVVLLDQAKSTIMCRLKESLSPGDHEIIIAEVIGGTVHNDEAKPMVHIRKSGLDY